MQGKEKVDVVDIIEKLCTSFWTFGGVALGAYISYLVAKYTNQQNYYYAESAKFGVAFLDTKIALRHVKEPVHHIVNEKILNEQYKAKIIFEPYISRKKRKAFNNVWKKYELITQYASPTTPQEQEIFKSFHEKLGIQSHPGNIKDRKYEADEILKVINDLLSFAHSSTVASTNSANP